MTAEPTREQQEWAAQEMRFRKEERQITLRWFWVVLSAISSFQAWEGFQHGHPSRLACAYVLVPAFCVFWAVRTWALTFRYRRQARALKNSGKPGHPAV